MGRRWLWIFVALVGACLALVWWAEFYTDWLWYRADAFPVVFWRRVTAKIAIFALAAPALWLLVALTLRAAGRSRPVAVAVDAEKEELYAWLDGLVGPAVRWLPVLAGLIGAYNVSAGWQTWLMVFFGEAFGVRDPRFGLDVGFYVYRLGALQQTLAGLNSLLMAAAAVTALTYAAARHVRVVQGEVLFSRRSRGHLLMLAAVLLVVRAGLLWLRRYQLLLSGSGLFPGAGWADMHVRQPALVLGAVTALLAAGLCLWVRRPERGARLAWWAIGVHLVLHAVAAGLLPAALQRVVVRPNELDREAPYLRWAIDSTRRAFGLDRVQVEQARTAAEPTAAALSADRGTLENVRVWDHRPLLRTFKQLQEIRQYYDIIDVDSDRYEVGGKMRQVLVAARELNPQQLDEKARSWLNQHLEYTHGFGLVASLASEAEGDGRPRFVSRDLPAQSAPALHTNEPRLYFSEVILMPPDGSEQGRPLLPGQAEPPKPQADEQAERWRRRLNDIAEPDSSDYLLVGTKRDEFDYPETVNGQELQRRTSYAGRSGVPVGGFWRRFLFGLRLHSVELMLTRSAGPDSKLLIHRQITRRCKKVAPFLVWDTSPYPVAVDGRVQWICEGYTMSQAYPYSQVHLEYEITPRGWRWTPTWNYLRNPVKAVVDAYDGTVKLYIVDDQDPLCRTFARLYPGVLRPASEAPASIRAHFRYPQMLFKTQLDLYQRYHMTEPSQFYSGEDLWAVAREYDREAAAQLSTKKAQDAPELYRPMAPYYIMMGLPGEQNEQFMLLSGYTPYSPKDKSPRDNMIAYLVGLCDGTRYGELRAYRFAKDRTIYGPLQVEALIDQDETISQLLTLWDKGGSKVIRGHLLTVPVADTLLYVQPLYLEAAQKGLPELKRVVVVQGQRVVLGDSFADALGQLFGAKVLAVPERSSDSTTSPAASTSGNGGTATVDRGTATADRGLATAAQRAFEAYDQAVRQGDWAAAQRWRDELGQLLGKLAQ